VAELTLRPGGVRQGSAAAGSRKSFAGRPLVSPASPSSRRRRRATVVVSVTARLTPNRNLQRLLLNQLARGRADPSRPEADAPPRPRSPPSPKNAGVSDGDDNISPKKPKISVEKQLNDGNGDTKALVPSARPDGEEGCAPRAVASPFAEANPRPMSPLADRPADFDIITGISPRSVSPPTPRMPSVTSSLVSGSTASGAESDGYGREAESVENAAPDFASDSAPIAEPLASDAVTVGSALSLPAKVPDDAAPLPVRRRRRADVPAAATTPLHAFPAGSLEAFLVEEGVPAAVVPSVIRRVIGPGAFTFPAMSKDMVATAPLPRGDRRRRNRVERNMGQTAAYLEETCQVPRGPAGVGAILAASPLVLLCKPSVNDRWDRRAVELAAFRHLQGHCAVPDPWRGTSELAAWVKRQHVAVAQRSLSSERVAILSDIGVAFEAVQQITTEWESRFDHLLDFKAVCAERGLPFPWDAALWFLVPDPRLWDLARWLELQRELRRRRLTAPDAVDRMEAVGTVWVPEDEEGTPLTDTAAPGWASQHRRIVYHLHRREQELLSVEYTAVADEFGSNDAKGVTTASALGLDAGLASTDPDLGPPREELSGAPLLRKRGRPSHAAREAEAAAALRAAVEAKPAKPAQGSAERANVTGALEDQLAPSLSGARVWMAAGGHFARWLPAPAQPMPSATVLDDNGGAPPTGAAARARDPRRDFWDGVGGAGAGAAVAARRASAGLRRMGSPPLSQVPRASFSWGGAPWPRRDADGDPSMETGWDAGGDGSDDGLVVREDPTNSPPSLADVQPGFLSQLRIQQAGVRPVPQLSPSDLADWAWRDSSTLLIAVVLLRPLNPESTLSDSLLPVHTRSCLHQVLSGNEEQLGVPGTCTGETKRDSSLARTTMTASPSPRTFSTAVVPIIVKGSADAYWRVGLSDRAVGGLLDEVTSHRGGGAMAPGMWNGQDMTPKSLGSGAVGRTVELGLQPEDSAEVSSSSLVGSRLGPVAFSDPAILPALIRRNMTEEEIALEEECAAEGQNDATGDGTDKLMRRSLPPAEAVRRLSRAMLACRAAASQRQPTVVMCTLVAEGARGLDDDLACEENDFPASSERAMSVTTAGFMSTLPTSTTSSLPRLLLRLPADLRTWCLTQAVRESWGRLPPECALPLRSLGALGDPAGLAFEVFAYAAAALIGDIPLTVGTAHRLVSLADWGHLASSGWPDEVAEATGLIPRSEAWRVIPGCTNRPQAARAIRRWLRVTGYEATLGALPPRRRQLLVALGLADTVPGLRRRSSSAPSEEVLLSPGAGLGQLRTTPASRVAVRLAFQSLLVADGPYDDWNANLAWVIECMSAAPPEGGGSGRWPAMAFDRGTALASAAANWRSVRPGYPSDVDSTSPRLPGAPPTSVVVDFAAASADAARPSACMRSGPRAPAPTGGAHPPGLSAELVAWCETQRLAAADVGPGRLNPRRAAQLFALGLAPPPVAVSRRVQRSERGGS